MRIIEVLRILEAVTDRAGRNVRALGMQRLGALGTRYCRTKDPAVKSEIDQFECGAGIEAGLKALSRAHASTFGEIVSPI